MARLLVTGFGPFGPHDLNPTALLMARLNGTANVVTAVLPVEYGASVARFLELVDRHRPDAAIAFGLAWTADRILVERIALNLDEAERPDQAGVRRRGCRIAADGPVGYWSTLPVDRLITAVDAAGLPVAGSPHAGGYVCNHLFFGVRHRLETEGPVIPMGFVHVPPLPEQVAGLDGRSGLELDHLEQAARIILSEVGEG
jgi:pyroglutamyl-peptidase